MPKPKVSIDEDGDGDTDVTVEIDTPDPGPGPDPELPVGTRQELRDLIARMEVHISPPVTRVTYATVRETLRGIAY